MLAACAGETAKGRLDTAADIARPAGLTQSVIEANNFSLTAFEKITAPGQEATLYIEGDGRAWLTRNRPSNDPSPVDPVALRLAAADTSANVIYIARPCQYTANASCTPSHWMAARFSPPLVESLNSAIAQLVAKHQLNGIRLVGFSGGGTMAALVAARRGDVIDLRTIAGNLDHHTHSAVHEVSMLDASLNPVDSAAQLRAIPQHHFIGANDDIVPRSVYDAYARALGPSPCLHHSVVPGMAHGAEWAGAWQRLQTITPACGIEP